MLLLFVCRFGVCRFGCVADEAFSVSSDRGMATRRTLSAGDRISTKQVLTCSTVDCAVVFVRSLVDSFEGDSFGGASVMTDSNRYACCIKVSLKR